MELHDRLRTNAIKNDSFADVREADIAHMLKLHVQKVQKTLDMQQLVDSVDMEMLNEEEMI